MRIESVEVLRVALPPRREHRWHTMTEQLGSYVLLRLRSSDGVVGWGEATSLGSWGGDHGRHDGEPPEHVWHLLTELVAPAVLGVEFTDRHELLARVDGVVRGHPYAKTSVEEAVLDLTGRTLGVPVYELLGGRRRTRIPLAHSLGLMDVDAAVAEAAEAVDEGIRTIKAKVGEDPDRDVELLRRLTSELPGVDIAMDANQGWRTSVQAERILARLEGAPLRYVEQPVEGLRQLEQLAERIPYPVMADESMWNAHEMADVARGGTVRLASIYTAKAGGLHNALAADAVAFAHGIGTNVNGSGETGIGNLANLHLAASMRSLSESCVVPLSHRADSAPTRVAGAMYSDDILTESMRYEEGHILVPDGPGWGMDVDEERIAHYTRRREVVE